MDGDRTRQRLIDVTIDLLDQDGNHGLRLADVAERAGVAVSTIYAHFRDRTDLVAAARLQQFTSHANEALEVVAGSLEPGLDRDGFVEVAAWPTLLDPDETDSKLRRWDRIEAIADSRHIPDLATQLGALQDSLNRTVIEFVEAAQARGWIDPTIDPAALAMFSQVLRLGLVQWDISAATRPEQSAWDDLIRRVFSCVLTSSLPTEVAAGRDGGDPVD